MVNVKEKIKQIIKTGGANYYLLWKIYYSGKAFQLKRDPRRYLEGKCKAKYGQSFNLDNPKTFNEKIQWLKLYWYDPLVTMCSDKYAVREYIKNRGLEHILNGIIGVYKNADEIDISLLPNRFVMKCTHGCHMNVICYDKVHFNWKKERGRLNMWLKLNYSYNGGEWVYRDIKPQIVIENFLCDDDNNNIKDYRIFCFNGKPKAIHVDYDVHTNYRRTIFNTKWELQDMEYARPINVHKTIVKPICLDEMLEYAKILSKPFPFVRVDFYVVNGKALFSELTFMPSSGYGKFKPEEYDAVYGSWITLPPKGKLIEY